MFYINLCNYCSNWDLTKKLQKSRHMRIDFKPFLKISHIVCCLKNKAILKRIAKIVFKAFFYLSNITCCLKYKI